MAQTVYASFADAAQAEKAAGALLDYGVRKEDLSLVANDAYGRARTTEGTRLSDEGERPVADTTAAAGRGVSNVGDAGIDTTKSAGDRIAQAGDRTAAAVTGAVGADTTAARYDAAADTRAANAETRAAMAGNEAAVHGSATSTYDRSDMDSMDADDRTVEAHAGDTERAAKSGISTTTPEDAGAGAVKGAGVGLGLGILAGLASLFVPGVGLVLGGGALAAALGGTALATGAGAIAGGVTGYLKEQGVPSDVAERYHGTIQNGGAMLAVNVPSGDVDQPTVQQVLSKYGAADVNAY